MFIPKTRTEAIELYNKRLRGKHKKLKYDMYLGGLICCSPTEFEEHMFEYEEDGIRCYLCCYHNFNGVCYAGDMTCIKCAQESLGKPWNEDLYLIK